MPNHLSILGIIHTAISVLAIIAAIVALIRWGKLSPGNKSGRLYIILTIITCITGFPIMKTGHPTAGHALGVIILVLIPLAIYARQLRIFGKAVDSVQIALLSLTLLLSMIPATVETLTRLPIKQPLANGPDASLVKMWLAIWFGLYIIGVIYQLVQLKKRKTSSGMPDNTVNLG
ncbi:hypothetical protein [Mucilaginibacter sp. SP1R1]|uniref:hypothetical protein n=1 Tax=Mucilaginibacter sp. SP1R1 TaxID=2723091 RepID=UPI001613B2E1|nr:hypothetical protein [Mucilaginibacter sp. SP1R1]MBB6149334.1 hypothetical protein [Mucilaginibacter sp. SP1R1]